MTKLLDKLWEKTQKSPNGYAFHKGRRSYWDFFVSFLVKQEYQALLELPYQQKFIKVLQMLGYKHTKLLENVK